MRTLFLASLVVSIFSFHVASATTPFIADITCPPGDIQYSCVDPSNPANAHLLGISEDGKTLETEHTYGGWRFSFSGVLDASAELLDDYRVYRGFQDASRSGQTYTSRDPIRIKTALTSSEPFVEDGMEYIEEDHPIKLDCTKFGTQTPTPRRLREDVGR